MMEDNETDEQLLERIKPLRIVMARRRGGNTYSHGVVEHSFGMDLNEERANVFWSGTAQSIIGQVRINAQEDAEYYFAHFSQKNPDMEFSILDPLDKNCPVEINIVQWLADLRVGERNKYRARNGLWKIREPEVLGGAE